MPRHPIRLKRHEVNVPQYLPRPMAEADRVRFFQVMDIFRDRLIFLLMRRCGMRVGEVRSLRWDAIGWQQGAIQPATDDYLFPSRIAQKARQPIARRTIQHLMTQYLEKAQITTGHTCHSLRHTFATQLLNSGASLEVVKELMGHHSIDMVLRLRPTLRVDHTAAV
jgi:site-specific recombinase XerD